MATEILAFWSRVALGGDGSAEEDQNRIVRRLARTEANELGLLKAA